MPKRVPVTIKPEKERLAAFLPNGKYKPFVILFISRKYFVYPLYFVYLYPIKISLFIGAKFIFYKSFIGKLK